MPKLAFAGSNKAKDAIRVMNKMAVKKTQVKSAVKKVKAKTTEVTKGTVIKTNLATKPKQKPQPKKKEPQKKLYIVTRAGIRRCATRAGIRCIQRESVQDLKDNVEGLVREILMRARSNALLISKTKTLRLNDIASAARNMGLGELVCC